MKAARRLKEYARRYYSRLAEEEGRKRDLLGRAAKKADGDAQGKSQSPKAGKGSPASGSKANFFRAGKARSPPGQTETNQAAQAEADFSSKSLTKGLAKLDSKQAASSTVARNLGGSKPEQIGDPDRPSSNDTNRTITEQSREENVTKQSVQDFFQKLEAIQVDQPISQLENYNYNEYNDDEQLTEECKDNGSMRPQT